MPEPIYEETFRDKISELLFNTTVGSVFCFVLCAIIFCVTLGIGYIGIGLVLAIHATKKAKQGKKTYYRGSGLLGVIFIWPVAILLMIIEGD